MTAYNNNNNKQHYVQDKDKDLGIELMPERKFSGSPSSPSSNNGGGSSTIRGISNGNHSRHWILEKVFGQDDHRNKNKSVTARKIIITLVVICMILYFVIDSPLEEESIMDDNQYYNGAVHQSQHQNPPQSPTNNNIQSPSQMTTTTNNNNNNNNSNNNYNNMNPVSNQNSQDILKQLRNKYKNGDIDSHLVVITEEGVDDNKNQSKVDDTNNNKVVITEEGQENKHQHDQTAEDILEQLRNKYKNGEIDSHIVEVNNDKDDKKNETASPTVSPKLDEASAPEEVINTTTYVPLKGKDAIQEKWGKWHFWDSQEDIRPKEDYAGKFPNRDVPELELPKTAWQADAVYVNHFLDSALELLSRAKEAIYTEYGHNRDDLTADELYMRSKMFHLQTLDMDNNDSSDNFFHSAKQEGGWTTEKSFDNLQRRLAHAVFTSDTFTVVLGGDANAAGKKGNHFLQSSLMQFHKIMEPIFNRLNVQLITRNLAHTSPITSSLGSSSVYGNDVDVIIWDDDSTTQNPEMLDLFYRQGLLGGNRAPILVLGNNNYNNKSYQDVLKNLHKNVGADIIQLGTAMVGIPTSKTSDQVKTLPYAVQYLKCENKDSNTICNKEENKFNTKCWVKRDDIQPATPQLEAVPIASEEDQQYVAGFKSHRLTGHVLAFHILEALQETMGQWSSRTISHGHPWDDEFWQIGDMYENIRKKALEDTSGLCSTSKNMDYVPKRVCNVPLRVSTEYTPRVDPDSTSLIKIVNEDGNISKMPDKNFYDGPNVPNPILDEIRDGELDIVTIVSNRRKLLLLDNGSSSYSNDNHSYLRKAKETIAAGSGWKIVDTLPGNCDGAYTSECGRLESSNCLLAGHMDSKGGIVGQESNSWLSMTLNDFKEGIILLQLDIGSQTLPDEFEFQFAVSGEIKSWTKAEFDKNLKKVREEKTQVEFVTLLNDDQISKGGKAQNLKLSIRVRNTGEEMNFKVTHVYWA